ncbi:MAG: hypothetical protein Faunusvirus5_26 [Faunusvirus sp.]|jgi:hypothetical protein|uniref:Uncharacterized protein n=1 Tax=Faunusvirus sp. TaxID=2487766 RepID=A0A3G4ZWD8_9VIRU|nr:MAG: hypothetical protein Faunusvirus5_26 [Faunusvirus sp.]
MVLFALSNIVDFGIIQKHNIYLAILTIGVLIIFTIIFAERIKNRHDEHYKLSPNFNLLMNIILLLIVMLPMILYTIMEAIGSHNGFVELVSGLFGSKASKNFLVIISYLVFIFYIFECVDYQNNEPNAFLGRIGASNRTVGLIVLIGLSLFYAYSVFQISKE